MYYGVGKRTNMIQTTFHQDRIEKKIDFQHFTENRKNVDFVKEFLNVFFSGARSAREP